MTVILGFSLCVLVVLLVIPDSQLGRMLHRQLVERPLKALSDIKRHRLIYFVLLAGMMLAGGEMIVLLGPEIIATYAVYLDAVMVTYALSAVAMAQRGGSWLRTVVRSVRCVRPRGKRVRRSPARQRRAANDDEPAPALLAA